MGSKQEAPERLYLQWSGSGDPNDPTPPEEDEVTWARDRVFDGDVEYVRADTVNEALAQVRDLESQVSGLSDALGEQAAGRAAWQGRAERLEVGLLSMLSTFQPDSETEAVAHENARRDFYAPRPSPSRILGVVRAAAGVCRDTPRSLFDGSPDTDHEDLDEALEALDHALETLTPEERQALGEDP